MVECNIIIFIDIIDYRTWDWLSVHTNTPHHVEPWSILVTVQLQ